MLDENVVFVEILTEGDNNAWAEQYGLGFPVVQDLGENIYGQYLASSGSFGIPTYAVIDRDMKIQLKQVSHGEAVNKVNELIADEIPDVDWPMPDEVLEPGEPAEGDDDDEAPTGNATLSVFSGDGVAPYGGAACNAGASQAGFFALLLGLLGLAVRRR